MKRLLLTISVCLSFTVNAQIIIDGKKAFYDSKENVSLAMIPKSAFGTNYKAKIELEEGWYDLTINGTTVTDSYTFENIKGGTSYPITVINSEKQTINSNITFTFLPILQLNGDFGYEYQQGAFSLVDADNNFHGLNAKIKWRGGTTNTIDKHKRNYKIKLDDDYRFFSLRNDNKWILDAGQADLFRVRNRIATELWNDMAHKPYYANKVSDIYTGVRGQMVEVFLNNEYRGIYCFTECMDRKELQLKKFDKKSGEIHGGLWKSEDYGTALMWDCPETYDNRSETWSVFEVKYPELDDVEESDYSTLWNAIQFVAYSTDDEFRENVASYFDIPVVIDYYIYLLALSAFDNMGKNMYWAVYDKSEDKKLTLAVWDLDGTVGAKWMPEWASPEYEMDISLNLFCRLLALNVDNFNDKTLTRYKELREGVLSTESLKKRYTNYYNDMSLSGADKREEKLWSKDSDIKGKELNFESEHKYIIEWIDRHMVYLDEFLYSGGNTQINSITLPVRYNHSIYNLNGQKMDRHYLKNKGVYIKDGKKYIIK